MLQTVLFALAFAAIEVAGAKEIVPDSSGWVQELLAGGAKREEAARSSTDEAWARAAATKPVVWNTNAANDSLTRKRLKEFLKRQYLDGYQLRGDSTGPSGRLAIRIITNWIVEVADPPPNPYIRSWGINVPTESLGEDPLVLTVAGVGTHLLEETTNRLERALKAFAASKHKAFPKFHAAVYLAAQYRAKDASRVATLDNLALGFLKELLSDGSMQPGDEPELAEVLINGWGQGFLRRNAASVLDTLRGTGNFEWLVLIVEGEYQINLAWQSRGGGYAETVTPEGWRGFEDHLAKARPSLTKAHQLHPDLPMAPYRMMTVALGSSDIREVRQWFDAAVAAQPDYMPAWKEMLWALRPRWFGSVDLMLAFGVTAAETKHYETAVPRVLLDSVRDAESELELPPGKSVLSRSELWPHLRDMFEWYLAHNPKEGYRIGSEYAVIAYLAERYDLSRQLMERYRWNLWTSPLEIWNVEQESMIQNIRLHTTAPSPEDAQAHLNFQAAQQLEVRLKGGAWVDFLPITSNLAGWKTQFGKWTNESSGSMTVEQEFQGHMLFCRASLGRDFEIAGSFEVLKKPHNAFQAGVVMGLPSDSPYGWYGIRFRHDPDGDTVHISTAWVEPDIVKPIRLNSDTNSFNIRFENRTFTIAVNGKEICRDLPAPRTTAVNTPAFLIGLGARNEESDAVIRYNSLKARRLIPK